MTKMSRRSVESGHQDFILRAKEGIHQARRLALQSGRTIVYAKDGVVYERHADGHCVEIEQVEAPRKVKVGWKAKLR